MEFIRKEKKKIIEKKKKKKTKNIKNNLLNINIK